MSDTTFIKKISLKSKLKCLKALKHDIRKQRVFLDESRSNFKLDSLEQITKVKNDEQVKGYPCVGESKAISEKYYTKLGVKINPYETKYPKEDHPVNLEHIFLK